MYPIEHTQMARPWTLSNHKINKMSSPKVWPDCSILSLLNSGFKNASSQTIKMCILRANLKLAHLLLVLRFKNKSIEADTTRNFDCDLVIIKKKIKRLHWRSDVGGELGGDIGRYRKVSPSLISHIYNCQGLHRSDLVRNKSLCVKNYSGRKILNC